MTDGLGTTSVTYDALNRPTAITDPFSQAVTYGYDAAGNRTQLTYPRGRIITTTYDALGRRTQVADGATTLATYTYDAANRLDTLTRANGISTTYRYDAANQITALTHTQDSTTLAQFGATYDLAGNRATTDETLPSGTRTLTYTYDPLRRLTGAAATAGTTATYGYDAVGNRTSVTVDGATTTTAYNAANQVVGWSYDATGNLLDDGSTAYSYDAANRLTSVTRSGTTTSFAYNGMGVLLEQTPAGGSPTRYVQDLVAPLSQVLSDGTTDYGYGGERLVALDGSTSTWYATDMLGSVRLTLDDSGAVLTTTTYDPWGMPLPPSVPPHAGGSTGTPAPFGFTGELQDATGLVYLRARWYNPTSGTFPTRDPFAGFLDQPYAQHPYQYAYSNPLRWTDPSGHYAWTGCNLLPGRADSCTGADFRTWWGSDDGDDFRRFAHRGFTNTWHAVIYGPGDTLVGLATDPLGTAQGALTAPSRALWDIGFGAVCGNPEQLADGVTGYAGFVAGGLATTRHMVDGGLRTNWLAGNEGQLRGRMLGATDKSVFRMPQGVRARNMPRSDKAIQAGRTFYPTEPKLKAKYPQGVTFTIQGYPDFAPYMKVQVKIKMKGNYGSDFRNANIAAGLGNTIHPPDGYTWHHHHDRTTMQLVPKDIHKIGHSGGVVVINEKGVLP